MAGKRQRLVLLDMRELDKQFPSPPDWVVPAADRDEEFYARTERKLAFLETVHAQGSPSAARTALKVCATAELPLPRWLANAVCEAIQTTRKGKPEDVFGFGNKTMLAQWRKGWLAERESEIHGSIDWGFEAFKILGGTLFSKAEFIKSTAHRLKMSKKAVEKIYYDLRKVPTGTIKK